MRNGHRVDCQNKVTNHCRKMETRKHVNAYRTYICNKKTVDIRIFNTNCISATVFNVFVEYFAMLT